LNTEYPWQKIPQDISALAEKHQLGILIKVYRQLLYVVLMYGCTVVFSGLILASIMYIQNTLDALAILAHGDLKLKLIWQQYFLTRQMPLDIVITGLSAFICVMHIFIFYLQQKQRLYIFSEGLLVSLGTVRKKYRAVRWDEIKELSSSRNVMRLTDGSIFALTVPLSSSMKKEIHQTIRDHIAPHHLSTP